VKSVPLQIMHKQSMNRRK